MDKKNKRSEMFSILKSIPLEEREAKSQVIIDTLLNSGPYRDAKDIFAFVSFKNEVMTHDFIKTAITAGKNIYVPIIDEEKKIMEITKLNDFSELAPGFFGVLEPSPEYIRISDPSVLDMVITPGVVFDENGYRIGYGGGYYDKFFSTLDTSVLKVGICFEEQVVKSFPHDEYDIPINMIISDKSTRIIK